MFLFPQRWLGGRAAQGAGWELKARGGGREISVCVCVFLRWRRGEANRVSKGSSCLDSFLKHKPSGCNLHTVIFFHLPPFIVYDSSRRFLNKSSALIPGDALIFGLFPRVHKAAMAGCSFFIYCLLLFTCSLMHS